MGKQYQVTLTQSILLCKYYFVMLVFNVGKMQCFESWYSAVILHGNGRTKCSYVVSLSDNIVDHQPVHLAFT
jgi:hypothetical protein